MKKMILALSVVGLFFTTGCETNDDTKVASAQACLDSARSEAEASSCVSKVDGIDTAQASLIRCGGIYMQRGFLTTRWTSIFNAVNDKTATGDPVMRMMVYIGFTGKTANSITGNTNSVDANRVVDECKKSGSSGMAYLSLITSLATEIYNVGSGNTTDLSSITGYLTSLPAATVGNIAIQAYQANCSGSNATTSQCTDLTTAYNAGGGDPTAVGTSLKNLLQN